jgi:mono/diheme cytochrome c family protein
MKYFLGVALAVLPALGQSGVVTPLALYTEFQAQPEPLVVDSLRQELDRIMAPLGFPLEWWSIDANANYPSAVELAVVTFRGSCSTAHLLMTDSPPGPLGFAYVTNGEVLPFAEVDCDRIRDFLREQLGHKIRDREAAFGRAVGRVVAHELFHIFAGTTRHGPSGVAESAFTQKELLSDRFELEASEFRILRASLKQARLQNSRQRSAASPLAGRFIFKERGCAVCHGVLGGGTSSAPSLRGAVEDAKAFAAKLTRSLGRMSVPAKLEPPSLDEDEIADVLSFLNRME